MEYSFATRFNLHARKWKIPKTKHNATICFKFKSCVRDQSINIMNYWYHNVKYKTSYEYYFQVKIMKGIAVVFPLRERVLLHRYYAIFKLLILATALSNISHRRCNPVFSATIYLTVSSSPCASALQEVFELYSFYFRTDLTSFPSDSGLQNK